MSAYILRRLLYAIPILIGVNLITFFLFFFINTPDDMARIHLGEKRVTVDQIARWKRERDYHLPYFFNTGWTEISVRQVAPGDQVSLALGGRPAGRYRLRAAAAVDQVVELGLQGTAADVVGLPRTMAVAADHEEQLDFEIPTILEGGAGLSVQLPESATAQAVVRLEQLEDLGAVERLTATIFWRKSVRFLLFQFGKSDDGRNIGDEIADRVGPSLAVTAPAFLIGLAVNITVAMFVAFFRGTYLDFGAVIIAVIMMSISILFYVIGGQWLLGKTLRLVPISGFDAGLHAIKFVVLPVAIGVIGGVGTGVRLYRTFFLEEIHRDYVRTARAKGLPESVVLFKHVLKNAMVPILTGVVVMIPFLIIGSLILESFFSIPGMGSFTLEAIQRQDFAIVQAMVFLGSAVYVAGLLLTDISYTLVDPRIRFS